MLSFKRFISEQIDRNQLRVIEKKLDKVFAAIGVDIEFTKHFFDRLNDPRNKTDITVSELISVYMEMYQQHGGKIAHFKDGFEGMIKEFNSDINIPFVINIDKRGEIDLIAKTIMRKHNFKTRTKVFKVY